jgi:hypothetical protein
MFCSLAFCVVSPTKKMLTTLNMPTYYSNFLQITRCSGSRIVQWTTLNKHTTPFSKINLMNASRCLTTHLNIFTRKTGGLIAMSRVTSAPLLTRRVMWNVLRFWRVFALYIWYTFSTLWALSIIRTVKLLNETQNIWASDLSDRKILITLEWGPFSLDIWET